MYSKEPGRASLDLNALLRSEELDPADVVVLRHRPKEPAVRKILPWLILERPDLFNLYQAVQDGTAAKAMARARYIAAFAGLEAGAATLAGIYEVGAVRALNEAEFWTLPGQQELASFGLRGHGADEPDQVLIDLRAVDIWADWVGRLSVDWPAKELSWFRRAERNRMAVRAITVESQFAAAMPAWDELVLTWDQLRILPASWSTSLAEWRGIYFIFDAVRQSGYVGSACGVSNILGRWRGYAQTGHGGNVRLKDSRAEDLRFSILQRTSPDMLPGDVVALETKWKARLHSREHGLNAN